MINNVVLMGRLTAAPELKATQNGTNVVSFTLAVNRRFKKDETDFINCVAWRQTAEFISNYFNKGDLIALTGEIQTRKYEVDGNKRTATEVIVNNATFCGGKNNAQQAQQGNNEQQAQRPNGIDFDDFAEFVPIAGDDDLPF